LIEPLDPPLPGRIVRLRRTETGIELYYPPLGLPSVALPLAVFGAIAFALPLAGAVALFPAAIATAHGLLTGVLVGAFVAPFALFGLVLVAQALFMVTSALHVIVDAGGIETRRILFGVIVRRRQVPRERIASIESSIAARHQSLVSSQPVYHLIAYDEDRRTRLVVGESLRGEALMEQVKSTIESALGPLPPLTRRTA